MFADKYFKRYETYNRLIGASVAVDLSLFVMIPCFREPDIIRTLESLRQCTPTVGSTEVFTVINEPEHCSAEISKFNRDTWMQVSEWNRKNSSDKLRFFVSAPVRLPQKWAGVGMARKRGMDEGLFRFNQLNRPEGVIVSLDADTLVNLNYLTAIEDHFTSHPKHAGATISFSHQLAGIDPKLREGILLYEKYMAYYRYGLQYAGYPHAMYTIGSAFAVRADAYMKRGGMTRRKAGEDFYFLQTLPQVGKVGEITETTVHPSSRVSDRVPFGTGPAMQHWMSDTNDLRYTYNVQAFCDLKLFFDRHRQFYRNTNQEYASLVDSLPKPLRVFLNSEKFQQEITVLSDNCTSVDIFSERFFQLFNAFRILKFIHFSHDTYYAKRKLEDVWQELMTFLKS